MGGGSIEGGSFGTLDTSLGRLPLNGLVIPHERKIARPPISQRRSGFLGSSNLDFGRIQKVEPPILDSNTHSYGVDYRTLRWIYYCFDIYIYISIHVDPVYLDLGFGSGPSLPVDSRTLLLPGSSGLHRRLGPLLQ